MLKSTASRLLLWGGFSIAAVFIALTLAGRAVGSHPLPWHTAWMVPFGKKSWDEGFHLSIQNGWTKSKVRAAIGDPKWILIDGKAFDATTIDVGNTRPLELWTYPSPQSPRNGWVLTFKDNILIDH